MQKTGIGFVIGMVLSATAWGQGLSTINGSVSDPSGAAIPGARISVMEVETGASRSTVSNGDGLYVLSSLRPTRYSLTVESAGFKNFTQTGILLMADDAVTINLKLELGATTESLTVEAAAVQIDTTTPTLRQVIDSARIEELPLNGRNAATLTTLVAGATIGPSNGADEGITKSFPVVVTISINGTRSNQTSYYLDGVSNTDSLSNVNAPFPMPDALQEFSVQTSNYSAEFGQNAGGVVNIVTKSGTNAFHGSAFGFVRNSVFNARDFFASARDPLKRSQYGGSLGGPIRREKLFFFGGFQGTKIRSVTNGLSSFVPTDANLGGDFSAFLSGTNPNNPLGRAIPVKDPTTGQNFANNLIPQARLDPASLALAKNWLPRAGGNGVAFYGRPFVQDFNEYTAKVDYNISNSDRAAIRYFRDDFDGPGVLANSNLLTYVDYSNFGYQSAALTETHIFTPNLLNEFRFGTTYESDRRGPPPNSPSVRQFGVNIPQGSVPAMEGITVSGFFNFGSFPLGKFPRAAFSWSDAVRYVRGRHSFVFTGAFERDRLNEYTETNQNGVFTFSGDSTGSALADFMLGKLRTFTQANGYIQSNRYNLFSIAAQDSFRMSSRLTLNYGVRWEPSFPWHDKYHEAQVFFPDQYAKGVRSKVYPNAPIGEYFPGDPGVPDNGRNSDLANIAPRVGFAYDLFGTGKTSLRGGAGIFYDSRIPGFANNRQSQSTPFSLAVTLTSPQGPFSNPYLGTTNPFPAPLPPPKDTLFPPPVLVYSWSPNDRISPVMYNMNLAVEHQLAPNWLARVAYVGSHASHLNVNEQLNPAVYIPGSALAADARRVYQGYSGILLASSSGNTFYNSMQATLQKRFSQGFTILANYTFSKSLDNVPTGTEYVTPTVGGVYAMSPNIPGFKSLDLGRSEFDRRHVATISYVWHLAGLSRSNLLLRGVAGGWELNGIVSAQSGPQLTIMAGQDRSQTAIGRDRGQLVGQSIYTSGACANVAPCLNFLNASSFALPANGAFGNLGKGALQSPGLFNWDMAMSKGFPIRERVTIRFRAEFFNLFNHENPAAPTSSVSGAGFGTIRSGLAPRIGQLALKITF